MKFKIESQNKYGSSDYSNDLILNNNSSALTDEIINKNSLSLNSFYKFNSKYICIYTQYALYSNTNLNDKLYYRLKIYTKQQQSALVDYELNLLNNLISLNK
jgi:hypothetical protein